MRASRLLVPTIIILGCAACSFSDKQDFDRYLRESKIEMTQGPAPEKSTPLGMIFAERSGFYLFGYLPIVTCNLRETLDIVVEEARGMKADGVSDLKLEYYAPSLIALSDSPLIIKFPWIPDIKINGMAYRKAPNK